MFELIVSTLYPKFNVTSNPGFSKTDKNLILPKESYNQCRHVIYAFVNFKSGTHDVKGCENIKISCTD